MKYILPAVQNTAANEAEERHIRYLITTLTACMVGVLQAWIRGSGKETPKELLDEIKFSFRQLGAIFPE